MGNTSPSLPNAFPHEIKAALSASASPLVLVEKAEATASKNVQQNASDHLRLGNGAVELQGNALARPLNDTDSAARSVAAGPFSSMPAAQVDSQVAPAAAAGGLSVEPSSASPAPALTVEQEIRETEAALQRISAALDEEDDEDAKDEPAGLPSKAAMPPISEACVAFAIRIRVIM